MSKNKNTLWVITAGSVDDGKSTLIGRLLHDAKVLTQDQMDILQLGGAPDFAALTDGLIQEKEQGITIDVAYRYFATKSRRYILADCPGHEDYTRNMVTGASNADVAIILIDPTKLDFSQEDLLLTQTKRHSAILIMLGVRNIVAAVNKMDAIDYDEKKYRVIEKSYNAYHQQLWQAMGAGDDYQAPTVIPLSALMGDNIIEPSQKLSWFDGVPLLPFLDDNDFLDEGNLVDAPAVFTVQYVLKNSDGAVFRGYQGQVASGRLAVGDSVVIMPQQDKTTIKNIYDNDGVAVKDATAPHLATIALKDEREAGRGSYIIADNDHFTPTKSFTARCCWFDREAWQAGRKYIIKHQTHETMAIINPTMLLDLNDMLKQQNDKNFAVAMNSIFSADIKIQDPIIADHYNKNYLLGSFIIIDPQNFHTLGAGVLI